MGYCVNLQKKDKLLDGALMKSKRPPAPGPEGQDGKQCSKSIIIRAQEGIVLSWSKGNSLFFVDPVSSQPRPRNASKCSCCGHPRLPDRASDSRAHSHS